MGLRITFFIINFCVITLSAKAQDITIADSLKEVLAKCNEDSTRYRIALTIARSDLPLEGLKYANRALLIAVNYNDARKIALAYEYIGNCHRRLGNNQKAINASLKALRIYDSLGMVDKTAGIQLQIGSHFTNDKDYRQGVFYIKQALETFKEQNQNLNIRYALINLGETYRLMGVLDSAEICFSECLLLNKEHENNLVQGYALGNLGMVHTETGKPQLAKQELKESINLLKPLGDAYSVAVYQAGLAKLYINKGNFEKGEKLLLVSLDMVKKEKLKEQIRDINNDLSNFYEQKGRYKQALYHRKQYEIYHDSLVNIENVRAIEQLHSKYWLDKKEANIQYLKKENRSKRIQVIFLASGIILLILLLLVLQRINRQRKKAFLKISQQKAIIEKREQEKALLLKELNHRVKNNLQMVASLINMQAMQCADSKTSKALCATRNRIDTLILIHQKLYSENEDMQVDLENYLRDLVNNLIYSTKEKVILSLDLTPVFVHVDAVILLGLIINELLTNSLKYAIEPGKDLKIGISLVKNESNVYLTISDNGKGIHEGNEMGKPGSMGMKLVNAFIRQLQGELNYEINTGSIWKIILNNTNLKCN